MRAAAVVIAVGGVLLNLEASGGVERAISREVVVDATIEQVWDAAFA